MKLAEFGALCEREWTRQPRGDVAKLYLGDASRADLTTDMLTSPQRPQSLLSPGALLNPVTRSVVHIEPAAGADVVFVMCGPGETRTLTLLPADARLRPQRAAQHA